MTDEKLSLMERLERKECSDATGALHGLPLFHVLVTPQYLNELRARPPEGVTWFLKGSVVDGVHRYIQTDKPEFFGWKRPR